MDKPKIPKSDAEEAAPHFQHPQSQTNNPAPGQIYNDIDPLQVISPQVDDLKRRLDKLEAKRTSIIVDVIDLFETVSVAPTGIPSGPWGQIKIYVNGATLRLYWFDSVANTWHYVTATA